MKNHYLKSNPRFGPWIQKLVRSKMVSIPGINRILLHLLGTVRELNMIKKRNTEKVGRSVEYVDRDLNFQDSSGVRLSHDL